VLVCDDVLTRRQARRLSRDFATIGVRIPAERLQEISAGATLACAEHTDINFALLATAYNREARPTMVAQVRRHAGRWLLVTTMALVSLSALIALALLMLNMVQPTIPG